MALIHSKQLNPKLTGSFIISGSDGLNIIGGTTSDFLKVNAHVTASGELKAEGRIIAQADISSSGNLFVTQNVDVDGTSNFAGDVVLQNNLAVAGHITASGNISNVSTTNVTASGDIEVGQYIRHKGDVNTLINFTDNRIRFKAGDIGFFDMEKDGSTPYPATINPGGNRINFRVVDRNTNLLLKTDSEAFNVGLYHSGTKKLETNADGIEVLGNVSGSSTSTGSFGKISMVDNTHLNSNGFAISGSSTSTASFGMVKIHAIAGNSPITFTDTIIENQNIEVVGHITSSGNIKTTGNIVADGDITAQRLIVSSSVTNLIVAEKSGSTTFGDDIGDTHRFTGSLVVTGSLNLENGRIFEQGSSVIDHATAMAIVFGG